jgi:NAD(P)-dependent dehydrogenase (short-subunit alcohol dehydrogenase family)
LLDHVSESIGVLHAAIAGGAGVVPSGYLRPEHGHVTPLRAQAASMLRAWAAAGPAERPVAIWDRELTASMVAVTGAIEITVHGWDIFVACGAARPVLPTSSSPSSAATRACGPRPGPPPPKPGTGSARRGDSAESGWSISVGRQTSGAEPQDHGITGGTGMTIKDKTVLVTGANRGIGQALVEEALRRGAARVYAAARQPVAHPDQRVTPLALDITDAEQIREAAASTGSLDLLINNAGIQPLDDLSDPAALEQALTVNLFGTYRVSQAFLPSLTRSRGTIVTNVSLAALAPVPFAPAYSISKAAAFSLTQSLRLLLARQGVSVHSVLTGPTDTEMTRGLDIPKASPESVARAIFDGIENGEEDIFPDPLSQAMAEGWRGGVAKQFERQNAALVPAEAATS